MADKCAKEIENKGVSPNNLLISQVQNPKSKSKSALRKEKRAMKKLKKKIRKNSKTSTNTENHGAPYLGVYKTGNAENGFLRDENRNYERVNDTHQSNLASDWNKRDNAKSHQNEQYLDNRFVADHNRNLESQRTVYNKSIHSQSATHFEMRGVHRNFALVPNLLQPGLFNNPMQVLYEENLRLKEELRNINQQWPSFSNNEVEIIFRRKDLELKLLPVLQDVVEGLLTEKFSVDDLKKFLTSDNCSSPKNDRQSPEGDLFSLDISSIPDPDANSSVPKYETSFSEILQHDNQKDKNEKPKIAKSCFNCSEDHHLGECPYMIDYKRVAAARKRNKPFYSQNVRYHVQGSKESEFKPGLLSDDLREAMGLTSNQIPLYIYQMRILGYPPGWMAEAAVESSGITVYGSDGNVEAGGNSEDGPSDIRIQHDPDKLIDYPGFNAVLPPDFVDEADKLGYPPIHFQDLRCVQESFMVKPDVRPKRKRELVENRPFKIQRCEVDMEMEENSDDDVVQEGYEKSLSNSFVPPLPIETLPPPPPDDPPLPPEIEAPPPPPPTEEESEPLPSGVESPIQLNTPNSVPPLSFNLNSNDAISGTSSPSLTELEEMRRRLQMELSNEMLDEDTMTDDALRDNALDAGLNVALEKNSDSPCSPDEEFLALESSNDMSVVSEISVHSNSPSRPESPAQTLDQRLVRSESRTSQSKFMTLGTPSLSRHSSYTKLPDYEHFSKNVTSHMNFENLPDSTGTFQKLKGVLKKVKEKMKFL